MPDLLPLPADLTLVLLDPDIGVDTLAADQLKVAVAPISLLVFQRVHHCKIVLGTPACSSCCVHSVLRSICYSIAKLWECGQWLCERTDRMASCTIIHLRYALLSLNTVAVMHCSSTASCMTAEHSDSIPQQHHCTDCFLYRYLHIVRCKQAHSLDQGHIPGMLQGHQACMTGKPI